uniref:Solute carrier family 35 member E2-like n=1 Tax=Hirondellea gigas TaxID=1518452 RepID=A0A2P2IB22_9CRUS
MGITRSSTQSTYVERKHTRAHHSEYSIASLHNSPQHRQQQPPQYRYQQQQSATLQSQHSIKQSTEAYYTQEHHPYSQSNAGLVTTSITKHIMADMSSKSNGVAEAPGAPLAITIEGMQHPRAVVFMLLWYLFSAGTLFLNKYILSYQNTDPYLLCGMQMFITMLCGAMQMRYPLGCYTPTPQQTRPSNFYTRMAILGLLQLSTIFFGLVALYYVAVSFAETVKSSAPVVTVVMAWLLRGEKTGLLVLATLLPVMFGLALCSSGELSFSLMGLICALTTNVSEVVQSVVSKTVLSDKAYKYTVAELQLFPNMIGVSVQAIAWLFLMPLATIKQLQDTHVLLVVILDGICFHGQTITAYVLMSYVSPVTYSVANTTKRALLIWLSILVFGNPITFTSAIGTVMVLGGVMLYSKAKDQDQRKRQQFSIPAAHITHHYK